LGDRKQILFGLFVAKPDLLMEKDSAKKEFCQILLCSNSFVDRKEKI